MKYNEFGISDKSYNLIIGELKANNIIEKAVIFGSRAIGNYKKGSDIDIAIFGKDIDFRLISYLSFRLNDELPIPYFVDIINFETIQNIELRNHILEKGKIFFLKITN